MDQIEKQQMALQQVAATSSLEMNRAKIMQAAVNPKTLARSMLEFQQQHQQTQNRH